MRSLDDDHGHPASQAELKSASRLDTANVVSPCWRGVPAVAAFTVSYLRPDRRIFSQAHLAFGGTLDVSRRLNAAATAAMTTSVE